MIIAIIINIRLSKEVEGAEAEDCFWLKDQESPLLIW